MSDCGETISKFILAATHQTVFNHHVNQHCVHLEHSCVSDVEWEQIDIWKINKGRLAIEEMETSTLRQRLG
jgi:hypothetical protein